MHNQTRAVDTRNTILMASLDLFCEHGYDATGVAQICQQAQVSKGAFYHHFSSKQDLFIALMDTWLQSVDGFFETASQAAETAPQALENMAAISGGLFEALEGGFPILLEFWTQASRNPVVWEQAVAPYQRYLAFFSQLFQAGKEEGSFDDALNPEHAARLLTSLVMGLLLQATFDPASADWQAVTMFGIQTLVKGMQCQL